VPLKYIGGSFTDVHVLVRVRIDNGNCETNVKVWM